MLNLFFHCSSWHIYNPNKFYQVKLFCQTYAICFTNFFPVLKSQLKCFIYIILFCYPPLISSFLNLPKIPWIFLSLLLALFLFLISLSSSLNLSRLNLQSADRFLVAFNDRQLTFQKVAQFFHSSMNELVRVKSKYLLVLVREK